MARQPRSGYRGFFEWSSSVCTEQMGHFDEDFNIFGVSETMFYTGFSTSHGYQIDPMFFIGAGLSMERCSKLDNWVAPLFVEGRADFLFGKFTPYADIRLGANLAEGVGAYFSPTIDYRFNWGRKVGINLGAGLTLSGYKVEYFEGTWNGPGDYEIQYVGSKRKMRPYFSFRLGIDF